MKIWTTILIILIFVPITSSATSLLPISHKPVYCFDSCHGERGFSYGTNDEYCGDCHSLYFGNSNFSEQHEAKSCSGCHKVNSLESFHPVHINVSCVTCHIDNTLPDNIYSECLSCHVSGLHSTHIERSCETCHTNTIPQKITPITPSKIVQVCDESDCWNEYIYETNNTNETKDINTSKPITNYKGFTIYEILMNLIKAIRDDIYGKNNISNPAVIVDSGRNMVE